MLARDLLQIIFRTLDTRRFQGSSAWNRINTNLLITPVYSDNCFLHFSILLDITSHLNSILLERPWTCPKPEFTQRSQRIEHRRFLETLGNALDDCRVEQQILQRKTGLTHFKLSLINLEKKKTFFSLIKETQQRGTLKARTIYCLVRVNCG